MDVLFEAPPFLRQKLSRFMRSVAVTGQQAAAILVTIVRLADEGSKRREAGAFHPGFIRAFQ